MIKLRSYPFFPAFILLICVASLSGCQTLDQISENLGSFKQQLSSDSDAKKVVSKPRRSCPKFSVVKDLNTFYEIPQTNEPSEKVGFAMAELTEFSGDCSYNSNKVVINMNVLFDSSPGPFSDLDADIESTLNAPYFIAVIDSQKNILAKDTFEAPLSLSADNNNYFHRETLEQVIPFKSEQKPEEYEILVGFQLSDKQLTYARQQKAVKTIPAAGDASATPDPLTNGPGII